MKIVIRRLNGRLFKEIPAKSKYHAKLLKRAAEEKYDHTYTVEVE